MHTTVFEYGYLTYEKSACDTLQAELISKTAFEYLKEVSLSASQTNTAKCLNLTMRYGYELIQVKSYVGVLFTPTGEHIEILPKVGRKTSDDQLAITESRDTLLMMLKHLGSFRYVLSSQGNVASKEMPLLEVFISQFLHCVNTLVKKGLKSDYVSRADNLFYQKGKLLVSKQLRHNLVNKHKFYVEYDEYLIDRPANRLIKTALLKLTNVTRLSVNQRLLRELQFAFVDVPFCKSIEQDFNMLKLGKGMKDYQTSLDWAKLILEGISPLSMKGGNQALSLMFPMEMVFENYVAAILRTQLKSGIELTTQARTNYLVTHNQRRQFQLKPDLLLTFTDGSKVVLDTKWKLVDLTQNNFGLSQSDFYQMFAYGQTYLSGKGDLYLIYPEHEGFTKPIEHSFDFSEDLKLWVIPFSMSTKNPNGVLLPDNGRSFISIDG